MDGKDDKGINHTIYADDITIWTAGGGDADTEEALQKALSATESFLVGTGLRCSPKKSELLLYNPIRNGRRPKGWTPSVEPNIQIYTQDGEPIPKVPIIRILGMFVEAKGSNRQTIEKITSKTAIMTRLLNRVTGRRGGIREDNLVRLFQAFLMSHITYVAAMHSWTAHDKRRLDTLIRQCIKKVLGVPTNTSTERLLQLGMHNTLEEIIEAQSTAQISRLSTTKAGREILNALSLNPTITPAPSVQLPADITRQLRVAPMPRNMHPQYNVERREARIKNILRQAHEGTKPTVFVDAAQYGRSSDFAVVAVDKTGTARSALTVRGVTSDTAEQVAIALALTDSKYPRVYTDSRAALRAFSCGWVAREAYSILRGKTIAPHTISWVPAHMGAEVDSMSNLNEVAHSRARVLTLRAGSDVALPGAPLEFRDALLTFSEISRHHMLGRRNYPPPVKKLSRAQEITLRQLQTRSYPNPALLHRINPDVYQGDCPDCEAPCSLEHMLWQCPESTILPHLTHEDWDAALKSCEAQTQLRAVQRAHDAALRLGLPAPTWKTPEALRCA